MYIDMEKRPRNRKPLGAARDFLHCVIREQKAATEELLASNRELEKLLEEVLASRAELRHVVDAETEPEEVSTDSKQAADTADRSVSQLRREVDLILEQGGRAIRDSSRLRQRSKKLREVLRRPGGVIPPAPAQGISKREHQVLTLIVQGKSSKEIAAELGISFKTAVTHRASIMSKLDVHEIASVVREAIRRGLV